MTGPIQSMNKLSMTSKSVLIGFTLYTLIIPAVSVYFMKQVDSQNIKFLQEVSQLERTTAISFLDNKNIPSACDLLEAALNRDLLRFYIIQQNGNQICSGPAELRSEIDIPYKVFNRPIISGGILFQSDKLDHFVVTTGTYTESWATFWALSKAKIPRMILAEILIMFIIAAIAFTISRPLRSLSTKHKGEKKKPKTWEQLGITKETALAMSASEAFSKKQKDLELSLSFITPDFSTTLLQEMNHSSASFPYFFAGTFLRFDLNSYTKLYFSNEKSQIAEIIKAIAIHVDEMVHRYGGTHYGFGGDEFIELFYGPQSKTRALFCARAIFEIPQHIALSESIKSKIKFKAALSSDEQTLFNRLPQCYSLTSDALILTNRYFSAIEDREQNSLIVGATELSELHDLASFSEAEVHQFKNISKACTIHRLASFPEGEIYTNARLMEYLKTDTDIIRLLQLLPTAEKELRSLILKSLKAIPVSICRIEVIDTWTQTLKQIDRQADEGAKGKSEDYLLLSSFINCGKNLLPSNMWTSELTTQLLGLKGLKDPRVEADVVELLSLKLNSDEFKNAINSLTHRLPFDSYRTKGNLLLAEGMFTLSSKLFKDLKRLINSENPNEVSTGIFVASKIIQLYRVKDPVALSQFTEVEYLIRRIQELQSSTTPLICERAQRETASLGETHV